MQREVIRPWPVQPEHKMPYVPGIKVNGGTLLFLSGCGPGLPTHRHPHVAEDFILPEDPAEQARRAVNKIKTIIETAGGSFTDIVKVTRYFVDIRDQDQVNEVMHEYFGDHLPCSTTVQVASLVVPQIKIEIEAMAIIPEGSKARPRPGGGRTRGGGRVRGRGSRK